MADWSAALDKFLRDTELPVLSGAGASDAASKPKPRGGALHR
jgi:hypothetical protein